MALDNHTVNLNNTDNFTARATVNEKATTTDKIASSFIATSTAGQNVIDNTWDNKDDFWLHATSMLDTGTFLCACIAFIINILNICAIILQKLRHKITYKFLISLALSDTIIASCFGMRVIFDRYFTGTTKLILNVVNYNLYHIGSMTCVLSYTAISVDLFVKNILPFRYESQKKTFRTALIIIWIIPVFLTESIQVGVTVHNSSPNESFLDTYMRLKDNTLGYINMVLAFLCLVLIFGLNLKVLKSVYNLLKRNKVEGESSKAATVTVIAIVTTYVVFYLPAWIIGILYILHYRHNVLTLTSLTASQRMFVTALLSNLKILNTVSDPVIYILRISVIREAYKRYLRKFKFWNKFSQFKLPALCLASRNRDIGESVDTDQTFHSA